MFNYTKKAAFGAAAVLAAVSLSGCKGALSFGNALPNFDRSYVVTAQITCDKLKASADVTRLSENDWEFCFSEPKELSGMILHFGESGYTAYLGGLSFDVDENSAYTMLPEIIGEAVDSLAKLPDEGFEREDGIITADTEFGGKKVVVTANEKTGELISLKCPYHRLSVAFSGQRDYVSDLPAEGGLIIKDE